MTKLTIMCQYAPTPGFYVDYQYNRGTEFLSWITTQIHTNNNFRNVGMLGIVNEPVQDASTVASMISTYYPNAYNVGLLASIYYSPLTLFRPSAPQNQLSVSLQTTTSTSK